MPKKTDEKTQTFVFTDIGKGFRYKTVLERLNGKHWEVAAIRESDAKEVQKALSKKKEG